MLAKKIEIMTNQEAIQVEKSDGTQVLYSIFPEFEVHQNTLPSQTIQEWHAHQSIEEILLITSGEIRIETIENQQKRQKKCQQGTVIRMNQSIHRLINDQENEVTFVVFRFVPQGKDTREKIKTDKITYSNQEIDALLNQSGTQS